MVDTPTREPLKLEIGDSWAWRREDLAADYPATSWTLSYEIVSAAAAISITAAADGDQFAISVAAATTAAYTAGRYRMAGYVTAGANRWRVYLGALELMPNLAAGVADIRSHARKVLDAIEAVIEGRAAKDQQGYTIAGRRLDRTPIEDLLKLRGQYMAEAARETAAERLAAGLADPRRVLVRFA